MTLQLSIIVPALNEAESLPLLAADLKRQGGIQFELVIVDGGSSDASCEFIQTLSRESRFPVSLLHSNTGRGRQMNMGAQHALAENLLFLHADSRLPDPMLLNNAYQVMQKQMEEDSLIAGHFPLCFSDTDGQNPAAYYYYEAKTHLNRPGCINGDQGFWMTRAYFESLGRFDESHPFMEDLRLARKVFETGKWVTLPGTLGTSARRFTTEGLAARQTINAIMCNFEDIGLDDFYRLAKQAYQEQSRSSRLALAPLLRAANDTLFMQGLRQGLINWYRTGGYVAQNSWQLLYAMDCKRNRRQGNTPGQGDTPWLGFYDRRLCKISGSIVGRLLAMLLTASWFYTTWGMQRIKAAD